jgi:glucose-1-phosphate thymidylyltransferase
MNKFYGLLPAAGLGTRMRPFRYPKELLPVCFESVPGSNFIKPKLLIEYSLEAFKNAGIDDVYVVIAEWKTEIMKYLEDGGQFNLNISYLLNNRALGLADALLSGFPWLSDKITCFAMPDTMFSPSNAFQSIIEKLEEKDADLVLGVFPTEEASHFAPVEFAEDGKVIEIWEKPEIPKVNNAWGIAVWNSSFWKYFRKYSQTLEPGISITDTFNKAAKSGLKVYCVYFADGWYKDIGRLNAISLLQSSV